MSEPPVAGGPDLGPKNGSLGQHLWIKVEVQVTPEGNRISYQSNTPPNVAIELLKDGIVGIAQQMVREEQKTLVKPVGPLPPLRRI